MDPFPKAIKKYFSFLFDHGFSIKEKEEINTSAFGNGYYVFMSNKVGIKIVLDRGQVLMTIGKVSQTRRDWLEWSIIVDAYASGLKAYYFDLDTDSQVKWLGELLEKYCADVLTGDFGNQNLHVQIEDRIGHSFLDRFLRSYPETTKL